MLLLGPTTHHESAFATTLIRKKADSVAAYAKALLESDNLSDRRLCGWGGQASGLKPEPLLEGDHHRDDESGRPGRTQPTNEKST